MAKEGVVAFAFGVPASIVSNQRIAQIASKKAKERNASVYTQLDVQIEAGIAVEYTEEKSGEPPPTLREARGAVQQARKLGLEVLWIAAAAPHLWRALRDLKYAIKEARAAITVRTCEEISRYPEEEWYCSNSTQKRASSRREWQKRDRILKLMPMFLYKLVAS